MLSTTELMALLMCLAPAASGQDPARQVPPSGKIVLPSIRLAQAPDLRGRTDVQDAVADRVIDLEKLADRARDPVTKADNYLAAANLLLARGVEPACTRELLGLAEPQDAEDANEQIEHVERLLDSARTAVKDAMGNPDLSEDWMDTTTRRLETLSSFAAGLKAFFSVAQGDEAKRTVRRAASGLSTLLEDDDPAVAAAANLWQAHLRRKIGGPDAALRVLDFVLKSPSRQGMPYALFARLLRCRLVAQKEGYAASLALLFQLEELVNEWLVSEARRNEALRAVIYTEIQILGDWHDSLSPTEQATEREWCVKTANKLGKESFEGPRNTLYRLRATVPVIAPPPGG